MAILPPTFRQRYFSASGLPLSGGKIFTYQAGTVTPLVTYTDATETSANTNPIILDANGECDLWLGGFAYKIVLTDSADVVQWTQDNVNQGQINSAVSADLLENLGVVFSPSNTATISVKTGAGNTPSISDPVRVGFRGGSLASGLVSLVNITSPLAMNITATATLGHVNAVTAYVYVYLINNNGVAELAVSSAIYQENALISTTAMSTAADSSSVIYSTTARTNVPIRLIARVTSNQTTAGVWVAAPTEIQTGEEARRAQINTAQIADLAVTTAKLADGAATSVKIADGAITNAKKGTPSFQDAAFTGSSFSTTSYVTIATISGFQSAGRLCEFGVYPSTETAYIEFFTGVSTLDIVSFWRIWDATNSVAIAYLGAPGLQMGSGSSHRIFLSYLSTRATMSAGTRNLELQGRVSTAGGRLVAYSTTMRFYAAEL